MQMMSLLSVQLVSVGYDAEARTLEVAFRAGGSCQYDLVPQAVYDGLLAASDPDNFYREHIRNRYNFQMIL